MIFITSEQKHYKHTRLASGKKATRAGKLRSRRRYSPRDNDEIKNTAVTKG